MCGGVKVEGPVGHQVRGFSLVDVQAQWGGGGHEAHDHLRGLLGAGGE